MIAVGVVVSGGGARCQTWTRPLLARLLATEADTVLAHHSGRPWLFGHGIMGEFRTVTIGQTRVVVIGTCLATDPELRTHVENAVRRDKFDALALFPGSYHLAVSGPVGMLVWGRRRISAPLHHPNWHDHGGCQPRGRPAPPDRCTGEPHMVGRSFGQSGDAQRAT